MKVLLLFCKNINLLALLSICIVACSHADTEVTSATNDENVIGSPIIAPEFPEGGKLYCQGGWVIVGYDITNKGDIVNVRVLNSEPPGVFDQSALDTFNKLRRNIEGSGYKDLKDVTHKFTYSDNEGCKSEGADTHNVH